LQCQIEIEGLTKFAIVRSAQIKTTIPYTENEFLHPIYID